MSELALQLIEKEKKEQTGILDLGNCGLRDIPEEVYELTWLEELRLANDYFDKDGGYHACTNSGPENHWKFEQISKGIGRLTQLKALFLGDILKGSRGQIRDIGAISELKKLTNLRLSNNQIEDLNPIGKLKNLNHLWLSNNQIEDLNPISQLKNLTNLWLNQNRIEDLNPISQLKKLTNLLISDNQIEDLNPISQLENLTNLYLNQNKIEDLNPISQLKNLNHLWLNQNKIEDLNPISQLKNLNHLWLGDNQIKDLSPLSELKNLTLLYLDQNKIEDLSALVRLLKKGLSIGSNLESSINLDENPLTNPPKSIVQEGREAVLEWFEQVDQYGIAPFFESKLMVLGQGDAGKTTFVNLQLDPDYQVTPGKSASTLGISVHKGKSFPNHTVSDIPIKAHLWDFGGQDIQKMLHQFFITESCLYVIVSDKRAENAQFDYWFQIIDLLGPKSEVLVLENPKNTHSANEGFAKKKYQELFDRLNIESLEVNLLHTRGKDKTKWHLVNESLQEKLSKLEIVNRPVPKKWALVRAALDSLHQKHISKDEYYALCEEKYIGLPRRHADLCLFYLNELGELVYFDDQELCTHIFLDHNWLTKGMYYILSDTKIEKNKGRFTRNQAYRAWNTHGYNEEEKSMLLSLLLKDRFDICYKLGNRESYITPLLLPTDKPEKWTLPTHLYFRYQYGFMPHGMFSRLMVKLHERIEGEQRWKTGMWLINDYEGVRITAEVQSINDPKDNQRVVDIKINGTKEGCKELLNFIRNGLNQLHREFENIKLTEKVGCNCDNCRERMQEGEKPTFYNYQRLLAKVQNKSYSVDCEHSGYADINIGQVLSDVVIENAAEDNNDSKLLHFLKEMNMSINQIKSESKVEMTNVGNSQAQANASAEAKASNKIHIEIQNLIGETEALKEDIEDERKLLQRTIDKDEIDVALRDVEKAEEAIRAIETVQQDDATPSAKSKNRFRRFIEDLSDEESTLHKTLKVLKRGKDYAKGLVKGYNNIANSIGQSPLGEAAMKVIEAI